MASRKGRPPFEPTDRQRGMVMGMALFNVPLEKIRERIFDENGRSISIPTLKRCFKKELLEGFTNVETNLATALYKRGLKNSDKAAMFILKCKFKWVEAQFEEGDDNEPLAPLTETQAAQFLSVLASALEKL